MQCAKNVYIICGVHVRNGPQPRRNPNAWLITKGDQSDGASNRADIPLSDATRTAGDHIYSTDANDKLILEVEVDISNVVQRLSTAVAGLQEK